MQIGDNYDLRYFQRYRHHIFCSNNAKTMELQTGEFPGWNRSPVALIRTCVVSQFATIATTDQDRSPGTVLHYIELIDLRLLRWT